MFTPRSAPAGDRMQDNLWTFLSGVISIWSLMHFANFQLSVIKISVDGSVRIQKCRALKKINGPFINSKNVRNLNLPLILLLVLLGKKHKLSWWGQAELKTQLSMCANCQMWKNSAYSFQQIVHQLTYAVTNLTLNAVYALKAKNVRHFFCRALSKWILISERLSVHRLICHLSKVHSVEWVCDLMSWRNGV